MKILERAALLMSFFGLFSCKTEKPVEKPNVILSMPMIWGVDCWGYMVRKLLKHRISTVWQVRECGLIMHTDVLCSCPGQLTNRRMHDCHSKEWNITRGGIYMKMDEELNFNQIKEDSRGCHSGKSK